VVVSAHRVGDGDPGRVVAAMIRPRRLLAKVAAATGGVTLGFWNVVSPLMDRVELRAVMDGIPVPRNFQRVGDKSGWSLLLGRCINHTRHWLVAGDAGSVQAQLREALGAACNLGEWGTDRPEIATATAQGDRGLHRVLVGVGTPWVWKDGTKQVPAPGQLGVTVVLGFDGSNP
jgi:hypothetical protein